MLHIGHFWIFSTLLFKYCTFYPMQPTMHFQHLWMTSTCILIGSCWKRSWNSEFFVAKFPPLVCWLLSMSWLSSTTCSSVFWTKIGSSRSKWSGFCSMEVLGIGLMVRDGAWRLDCSSWHWHLGSLRISFPFLFHLDHSLQELCNGILGCRKRLRWPTRLGLQPDLAAI